MACTSSLLLQADRVTHYCVRGLQTLGLAGLGMSWGFERLHYLLESAFDADGDLSPAFLKARRLWSPQGCRRNRGMHVAILALRCSRLAIMMHR